MQRGWAAPTIAWRSRWRRTPSATRGGGRARSRSAGPGAPRDHRGPPGRRHLPHGWRRRSGPCGGRRGPLRRQGLPRRRGPALGRPPPAIAVVVTPPEAHHPVTERAAAAGVHVLCETPLSFSLACADRMIAAARAAGTRLETAENVWRRPEERAKRALIERGLRGTVGLLQCRFASGSYHGMNAVGAAWRGAARARPRGAPRAGAASARWWWACATPPFRTSWGSIRSATCRSPPTRTPYRGPRNTSRCTGRCAARAAPTTPESRDGPTWPRRWRSTSPPRPAAPRWPCPRASRGTTPSRGVWAAVRVLAGGGRGASRRHRLPAELPAHPVAGRRGGEEGQPRASARPRSARRPWPSRTAARGPACPPRLRRRAQRTRPAAVGTRFADAAGHRGRRLAGPCRRKAPGRCAPQGPSWAASARAESGRCGRPRWGGVREAGPPVADGYPAETYGHRLRRSVDHAPLILPAVTALVIDDRARPLRRAGRGRGGCRDPQGAGGDGTDGRTVSAARAADRLFSRATRTATSRGTSAGRCCAGSAGERPGPRWPTSWRSGVRRGRPPFDVPAAGAQRPRRGTLGRLG